MLTMLERIVQAAAPLCLWLAALSALFVPLERLAAVHPRRIFRKQFATDLGYYFLNGLTLSALMSIPVGLLAWGIHRLVPGGFLDATAGLPVYARVPLGLIVGEVGYYWGHRLSHEVPLLWRFHSIHHSAEEMDFLTNTRAHPLDLVFTRFCALAPMYVLGLSGPTTLEDSLPALLVLVIGTSWGFFIHANLRWRFGLLEWLVATPAFHHWHHVRSGPINRNYASMLPWIDGFFGTWLRSTEFPKDYGIDQPMADAMVDQLVHPFFPPPGTNAGPRPAVVDSVPEPLTEAALVAPTLRIRRDEV